MDIYLPPKPAIILAKPRDIIRRGDPRIITPPLPAMLMGGLGVTALCGGAGTGLSVTETVTGTWPQSPTDSIGITTSNRNLGFQFTATVTGTIRRYRIKTAAVSAAGNCTAKLYTNSSGSPGTQIGSDSNTVNIASSSTEYTFAFGTEPAIVNGTIYWAIVSCPSDSIAASIETMADQAGYGSGRNNTITSITDNGLGYTEDWRWEVVQGS